MKIMFVTPYFKPKIGGLENYAFNIAEQLSSRGHEITVVTSNHLRTGKVTEMVGSIKVIRLPITHMASNTPLGVTWRRNLREIIQLVKPDIINGHLPVPGIADTAERVRGGTPFVLTYHNDLVKSMPVMREIAKIISRTRIQKTINGSDQIIATSEYYAANSPYLAGVREKINVVSPGIKDSVKPTFDKRNPKNNLSVIFVAQLDRSHRHKGLDILLNAARICESQYHPIDLTVVGDGDEVKNYKVKTHHLGLKHVKFIGRVTEADLAKYYRLADVLVLPSTNAAEGFGMVILEAAGYGVPSVASRIGGIPAALIDHETGILVEPGNSKLLADALINLANNESLRLQLGKAAYKRAVNDYSWAYQGELTERIFQNVLGRANA